MTAVKTRSPQLNHIYSINRAISENKMVADMFDINQIFAFEMRSYLGSYLSTGNKVLDMIVGVFIFRFLSRYLANPIDANYILQSFISLFKSKYEPRPRSNLSFSIENQSNGHGQTYTAFTAPYKAIMYRLGLFTDDRINHLRESSNMYYDQRTNSNVTESVYEVIQKDPIEVEPGVFIKCEEVEQDRPNPNTTGTVRIRQSSVKVYSYDLYHKELEKIVERWVDDYRAHKNAEMQNKQFIFNVRFGDNEEVVCSEFKSNRSFDNFFFEQKDQALAEIDFFLTDTEWYKTRGLPNSLGILGHGHPGCGKTSFIKALLNKTQRHAVVFSVNRHTNLETIERLMRTETLCDYPIPQNQRIYVLEDIDAMGDIVLKRDKNETEANNPQTFASSLEKELQKKKEKNKKKQEEQEEGQEEEYSGSNEDYQSDKEHVDEKIDTVLKALNGFSRKSENHMSFFLNLIDGVIETKGRIIVMTTNHVHKLDPALIRPGRIDVRIEFKKCTNDVLCQILSHFYEMKPEDIHVLLSNKIEEEMFSPAEVARICRAHKLNLNNAIKAIENETMRKKEYGQDTNDMNLYYSPKTFVQPYYAQNKKQNNTNSFSFGNTQNIGRAPRVQLATKRARPTTHRII